MKTAKKLLALVLCLCMICSIVACGNAPAAEEPKATEAPAQTQVAPQEAPAAEENTDGYQVNQELLASEGTTLTLYGPGVFTETGADGSIDLISGVEKIGYNVLIERWNELYPNCELVIEATSWDNWMNGTTAACLTGEVDILAHGATMIDLNADLTPFFEKDPEFASKIYQVASRLTTDDMAHFKVAGVDMTIFPAGVWLDKDKFDHYGVEIPSTDWTYSDMLAIAEKLTGTDPVTGEQTYGIQHDSALGVNLWFNHVVWANSLGANIFTYKTNLSDAVVDYTCAESVQAFQMVADLAKFASPEAREGVGISIAFDGTNDWAMLMNEGITSDWVNIVAAGNEDRYLFLPFPTATAGRYEGTPSPYSSGHNLAIYKDSPDKEWAWEFIKFMCTDPVALEWVLAAGYIPNTVKGLDYAEGWLGDQLKESLSFILSNVPENYNNASNYAFNNISFGPTTANLTTAVDNVINGYMTPEEAAQFMQESVDEYLASVR